MGLSELALTDVGRPDPWLPAAGDRKILVSLYYPARKGSGVPASQPYLTADEARQLLAKTSFGVPVPPGSEALLSATRTHARDRAVPARGRFPLVVISPGLDRPRATMPLLAEELASRGYVVAFFDQHLKGRPQPLLDGPSPGNPEVVFIRS
ncbi:hypothetical protein [Streptomyces albipurpureus]|uniref:Alpha/beta hydrolase n=1 Tax=Streptomyces albipurpureus TaxID=2897419 RepID=A0ABT0UGY5_9ACTN|nr:hypothetical protein [Streptomyces sp. CWNU-1]MCM2386890.1 hypothetical protein [Streptomyces sp. CWNU-1]